MEDEIKVVHIEETKNDIGLSIFMFLLWNLVMTIPISFVAVMIYTFTSTNGEIQTNYSIFLAIIITSAYFIANILGWDLITDNEITTIKHKKVEIEEEVGEHDNMRKRKPQRNNRRRKRQNRQKTQKEAYIQECTILSNL